MTLEGSLRRPSSPTTSSRLTVLRRIAWLLPLAHWAGLCRVSRRGATPLSDYFVHQPEGEALAGVEPPVLAGPALADLVGGQAGPVREDADKAVLEAHEEPVLVLDDGALAVGHRRHLMDQNVGVLPGLAHVAGLQEHAGHGGRHAYGPG